MPGTAALSRGATRLGRFGSLKGPKHTGMRIDMCMDMRIDMCMDVCMDVGMGMCMGMRMDMRMDMRIDMRIDMHADMCIDMWNSCAQRAHELLEGFDPLEEPEYTKGSH